VGCGSSEGVIFTAEDAESAEKRKFFLCVLSVLCGES
jgi:hypothetical protein